MIYTLGPYVGSTTAGWTFPAEAVAALDLRSNERQNQPEFALFVFPDGSNPPSEYRRFGSGDIRELNPRERDRSVFASMLGLQGVSGTTLAEWLADTLTLRADPAGAVLAKPVIPGRNLRSEIYLQGHAGPVYSAPFRLDRAEVDTVRACIGESYRRLRQEALDGRIRNERGEMDPEFHRRVLGYWGRKFRVQNPEDFFIPGDLPKESPLPPRTTISDDFNRADASPLSNAAAGWSWTIFATGAGTLQVLSNAADSTASDDVDGRANSDLSGDDHYSQVLYSARTTGNFVGPNTRFDSSARQLYRYHTNSAAHTIEKWVSGTLTTVATGSSSALALPHTLKLESDGSSHTGSREGVTKVGPSTDTSLSGQVRCGFHITAGSSTGNKVDDFTAADLTAGSILLFVARDMENIADIKDMRG